MKLEHDDRMKQLLQNALASTPTDAEPSHELWPVLRARLQEQHTPVPWFDWLLAAALAGFVAAFPAALPMLLYYL